MFNRSIEYQEFKTLELIEFSDFQTICSQPRSFNVMLCKTSLLCLSPNIKQTGYACDAFLPCDQRPYRDRVGNIWLNFPFYLWRN